VSAGGCWKTAKLTSSWESLMQVSEYCVPMMMPFSRK
jgi:hypothetical protein